MPEAPSNPTASSGPGLDNSNLIIIEQLKRYARELEEKVEGDCLALFGAIEYGLEEAVLQALERRRAKRAKLAVILETPGGYIEVAQRIADVFRHHYTEIEFIVPNYAMSAGTVLTMAGDSIWMDYYSVLGPIDPQVERPDGNRVPALGYLIHYDRLIAKAKSGRLTSAEVTYLVTNFNPAELYRYEQARDHSIALLKEWLVKYKFKNWTETETKKKRVTARLREQRAEQIARILQDTDKWNSHGRGISMEVLRRDVNLRIDDFGADLERRDKIRRYYRLIKDFTSKIGFGNVIHYEDQLIPLLRG